MSGGESEDSGQASEGEGSTSGAASGSGEIHSLLQRKQELERSHRLQEKRRQKVQVCVEAAVEFICSCEKYVRTTYCYNIYTSLNTVKLG